MSLLMDAKKGDSGVITSISLLKKASEVRLAELGFRPGAKFVVVEEAPVSRDPIVIAVNDVRFAVRRSLLEGIKVGKNGE